MARGGARRGAGKKRGSKHKKTLEQLEAAKIIRKEVSREIYPLITAALDLAVGVYKEVKSPLLKGKKLKGIVRVYRCVPDGSMLDKLFERIAGKVIQPLGGQGDGLEKLTDAVKKILEGK